jgi:Mg2+/citrate symporter
VAVARWQWLGGSGTVAGVSLFNQFLKIAKKKKKLQKKKKKKKNDGKKKEREKEKKEKTKWNHRACIFIIKLQLPAIVLISFFNNVFFLCGSITKAIQLPINFESLDAKQTVHFLKIAKTIQKRHILS